MEFIGIPPLILKCNRQNQPRKSGIPRRENQVTLYALWRNGGQGAMVVDPRPERGIGKEGKQVKFGKGLYGALLPMAMSPTKN